MEEGRDLVRPERFELPTCCSGGNRSIQLSYGRSGVIIQGGGPIASAARVSHTKPFTLRSVGRKIFTTEGTEVHRGRPRAAQASSWMALF
jgi:hypothetical protein